MKETISTLVISITRQTEKAILVKSCELEVWIPKSQVIILWENQSRGIQTSRGLATLELTQWIVDQKPELQSILNISEER